MCHACCSFDFRLLVRDMQRLGLLAHLQALVAGAVDTMPLFRAKLPLWGNNDFGLVNMAVGLGVPAHGAHDALRDAEILEGLCQKLAVTTNDLWSYAQQLP